MQNRITRTIRGLRHSAIAAFAITAVVFAICCSVTLAQSGAGNIQGTIADPTGAVIPGAAIHVVNNATGVATNAKSNGAGFYQVPDLFTGPYTITVIAPGMKTFKTSITLLVAQNAVVNAKLTPGAVSQEVIVNADAVQLVTTDDGAITSTLENARINQLPENGRDITTLMNLTTPGLENSGQNLNGVAAEGLSYVVDGAPTQNNLYGGLGTNAAATAVFNTIDPDSVQEIRLEANGSGAQYASPGTAIVSTKSGTNALHGSLFETSRNNAIGVARGRADLPGPSPKYDRNEFGVSVGGPIVLPHIYHGKDKSFFFFAYERYSLVQDVAGTTAVPTPAMRNGDFSGLINAKGVLQTLYDPSTTYNTTNCAANVGTNGKAVANPYCRKPFPTINGLPNQIPVSEESPTAKIYYQLVPLPAGPNANADPLVLNNLNYVSKAYDVAPQVTFRLDHVFTENNRAYLRFSEISNPTNTSPGNAYNVAVPGIPSGAALGYTNSPSQSFLAGAGYTHVFSPTFFAETILSQQWLNSTQLPGVNPDVDYEAMLGLPNNFGESGFPALGNSLITNLKSSQSNSAHISQIISTADENFTKVVGRHQLLFGGRFRHQRMGDKPNGNADNIDTGPNGVALYQPTSGALYNAVTNTGSPDASFFVGQAASYNVNLEPPHVHYHINELDAYLQDNYHVSRNLTLNLGLRYEAHPGLWTKDGLVNTFDLNNDAVVLGATPAQLIAKGYTTQAIITNDENIGVKFETPQQAGLPDKLMYNYYLNFLPRVGFAWLPFEGKKTVIRGAYGVYDYPTPLEDYVNHPETNNPFEASYTQSYSSAAQAIDGLPNELLRYDGPVKFGQMGTSATANAVNTNSTNSILPGIALTSVSPHWAPEHVTEVNATIEQPLKGNSALRVSWIFTRATNLYLAYHYNKSPTSYQYELAHGVVPPTGGASVIGTSLQDTYAATATGPYDQTTWGNSQYDSEAGWSNYNALQINYQRLFHHGAAYQVAATYAKSMALAGTNDSQAIQPDADFPGVLGNAGIMTSPYGAVSPGLAPPPRPTNLPVWANYKELDRYEGYQLDSSTPVLHIKGNGVYDLPVGRGKFFLGHVSRFWNEVVGGYQIAGTVNIASQLFQPPSADYGPSNPISLYRHKEPVQDCRSGVCQNAYMWYNGYLAPTVLTPGEGGTCTTDCVTGLPASYVPYLTPIDNTPGSAYYGDNEVNVTLANGTTNSLVYDDGPQGANRFAKTYINGPVNWTMDASIFKVFPITQRVNLRVNVDAFNALNVQGFNNPDAAGVETLLTSHNTPRQIQLTARLTF